MKTLITALILLSFFYSTAQEISYPITKNVVKLSAATMGFVNGMASIDCERQIYKAKAFTFNVEATYGQYYQVHDNSEFVSHPCFHSFTSALDILIGKKSHFLNLI